ncbi:MAG: hypothetical protein M0Z41_19085 [Peptococcaceae bacterium]|nr:hypothetical protein [Peptococcaceae bacterium]
MEPNQAHSNLNRVRKKKPDAYLEHVALELTVAQWREKLEQIQAEAAAAVRNPDCVHGGPLNCPAYDALERSGIVVRTADAELRRMGEIPPWWLVFTALADNLADAGCLTPGWTLTAKGKLALDCGPGWVLLAEIVTWAEQGGLPDPETLAAWAGGCLCERDEQAGKDQKNAVDFLRKHGIIKLYSDTLADAVSDWASGLSIKECARVMDAGPGDLVMLARRAAECLRGIGHSRTCSKKIADAARHAYRSVWRDEVSDVL